MKATDAIYAKSNKIETVALNKFSLKEVTALLEASDSCLDRQKKAQIVIDYLCGKFKMPTAKVIVKDIAQPHTTGYDGNLKKKILGTYQTNAMVITVYNLTAARKQNVAIKTFLGTLIHEFMHHYDMEYLKLGATIHSAGFYRRIGDLESKLK